jgi:hypothetical protein
MDAELKALLSFVGTLFAWIAIPLLPAWLTFRITPSQQLGLRGPLQGLTLRASGAFSAYLVVFLTSSMFVWTIATGVIGRMVNDTTWTVTGKARFFDSEGAPLATAPNMSQAVVRMSPEPHSITPEIVSLHLPFKDYEKPAIYVEIPGWGGGRIAFTNASDFIEDSFAKRIQLKNYVIFRQQPHVAASIGPTLADRGGER